MIRYLVPLLCLLALTACASGSAAPVGKTPTPQAKTGAPMKTVQREISAGDAALRANDFATAYADFTKAIDQDHSRPLAYEGRGTADYNLGRSYYKLMRFDFSRAANLQPPGQKSKVALDDYNVGLADLLQGHFLKSATEELTAIRLNPALAGAYFAAGTAYEQLGSTKGGYVAVYLQQAVDMFKKVIYYSPQDFRGYVNLGIAYANLHKYREADDTFTHAIAVNPQDAVGWFNRGLTRKEWKHRKQALADFKQALKRATNPQLKASLRKLIQQVS